MLQMVDRVRRTAGRLARRRCGRALAITVVATLIAGACVDADEPRDPRLFPEVQLTSSSVHRESELAVGPDGTIYVFLSGGLIATGPTEDPGQLTPSTAVSPSLRALGPDLSLRWSLALASGGPPSVAADGTVYLPGTWAVTPDGAVRWKVDAPGNALAVVGDHTVLVAGDVGVRRLDAATGRTVWHALPAFATHPNGTPDAAALGVHRDRVYVVGRRVLPPYEGYLFALDPDGQERWRQPLPGSDMPEGLAIGDDGAVFLDVGTRRSYERALYAFEPTGEPRFILPMYGGVLAVGPGGTLYSATGGLHAIDPATGWLRWSLSSGPSFPAVSGDGRVHGLANLGDSLIDEWRIISVSPGGLIEETRHTQMEGTSSAPLIAHGRVYTAGQFFGGQLGSVFIGDALWGAKPARSWWRESGDGARTRTLDPTGWSPATATTDPGGTGLWDHFEGSFGREVPQAAAWDPSTGDLLVVSTVSGPGSVGGHPVDPDGAVDLVSWRFGAGGAGLDSGLAAGHPNAGPISALAVAPDGTVLLVGVSDGASGVPAQVAVMPPDLSSIEYTRVFETGSARAELLGLASDDAGGRWMVGRALEDDGADIRTGPADRPTDALLIRTDASGTPTLFEVLGASGTPQELHDVALLEGGDLVVAGAFQGEITLGGRSATAVAAGVSSQGSPLGDLLVARLRRDGSAVWLRRFSTVAVSQSSTLRRTTSIATGPDDRVFIGGYADGAPLDIGHGPIPHGAGFLIALDGDGEPVWTRAMGVVTDVGADDQGLVAVSGNLGQRVSGGDAGDATTDGLFGLAGFDRCGTLRWATGVTGSDSGVFFSGLAVERHTGRTALIASVAADVQLAGRRLWHQVRIPEELGDGPGDVLVAVYDGRGGAPFPDTCAPEPLLERHLRVIIEGDGRVRAPAAGIDCPGKCEASVPSGSGEIALTASWDAERVGFDGWGGACEPAGAEVTCRWLGEAHAQLSAHFSRPAVRWARAVPRGGSGSSLNAYAIEGLAGGDMVVLAQASGEVTVAGTTITPAYLSEGVLLRLAPDGAPTAAQPLGLVGQNKQLHALHVDGSDHVVVRADGQTALDAGGGEPPDNPSGGLIIRFTPELSLAWVARTPRALASAVDVAGDVLLAGVARAGGETLDGAAIPADHAFVARLDAADGAGSVLLTAPPPARFDRVRALAGGALVVGDDAGVQRFEADGTPGWSLTTGTVRWLEPRPERPLRLVVDGGLDEAGQRVYELLTLAPTDGAVTGTVPLAGYALMASGADGTISFFAGGRFHRTAPDGAPAWSIGYDANGTAVSGLHVTGDGGVVLLGYGSGSFGVRDVTLAVPNNTVWLLELSP